eukprot:TCONS_00029087-protein
MMFLRIWFLVLTANAISVFGYSLQNNENHAKVFISQSSHSEDVKGCGEKAKPCRSIQYANLNVCYSKAYDKECHLILDGGSESERYSYIISNNEIIILTNPINSVRSLNSSIVPHFVCNYTFRDEPCLVVNGQQLTVDSINFVTIGKKLQLSMYDLQFSSAGVGSKIKNCEFHNAYIYFHAIKTLQNIKITASKVMMDLQVPTTLKKFDIEGCELEITGDAPMTIKEGSKFVGTSFKMTPPS